jgi:hypothetical protein
MGDAPLGRTRVLLPTKFIEEVDRLAGKRKRSQFLAEAAEHELNGAALGVGRLTWRLTAPAVQCYALHGGRRSAGWAGR